MYTFFGEHPQDLWLTLGTAREGSYLGKSLHLPRYISKVPMFHHIARDLAEAG